MGSINFLISPSNKILYIVYEPRYIYIYILPLSRIFQSSSVKALQKGDELRILKFYFSYEGQIIIFQSVIIFSFTKNSVMGTYAIIETGGEQLRVEPGRFYDVRRFTPSKPNLLGPNAKV